MWQTFETSKDFFRGNYEEALRKADAGKAIAAGVRVGCLIFRGRIAEAELLLKEAGADPEQKAMAGFFLGVGLTRQSRYAEARRVFARNLRSHRRDRAPVIAFFAWQGLAFFNYFRGRFAQSMRAAERAAALAEAGRFAYGRAIALDVMAHSSVHAGEVRRGLGLFREALTLVEDLGNGGLETAIRISLVKYEAAFGLAPGKAIASLKNLRKDLRPTDTYSLAEINLELIRQYILRGRADEAQKLLDESYDVVHRNQNRRQSATLNLRSAHLQYLNGEFHHALHLLRMAHADLHQDVDVEQSAQLRGLESQIHAATAGRSYAAPARRAVFRRTGEDPLGDLIARMNGEDAGPAIETALRAGWLLPVVKALKIDPGSRAMVFGLRPGTILLLRGAGISLVEDLKGIQRTLLDVLARGEKNKAALIEGVWGYTYDPLRHDSLIYAAVRRLRDSLGDGWIEVNGDRYRLSAGVRVLSIERGAGPSAPAEPVARRKTSAPPAFEFHRDLNVRQNEILEALFTGERRSWSAGECRRLFKTSTMTATRDLTELCGRGFLEKIGRARATRYVLGAKV